MKNIKLILLSIVLLTSCNYYDRYELDNLVPEKYHKILYFPKDGKKEVTLYTTGEDNSYHFPIFKGGSKSGLTAEAKINIMTQEEVDKLYNDVEGEKYKVINKDCYSSESDNVTFSSEENYKIFTFDIKPEKIKELIDNNPESGLKWVLPIHLSSEVDSVNSNKDKILLYFSSVKDAYMGFTEMWNENFTTEEIKHIYGKKYIASKSLKFGLITENRWDIKCDLQVENQDYVNDYNQKHNTKYELIPDGIYTLPENIALKDGNETVDFTVSIDCSTLMYNKKYILPVRVKNPSKFKIGDDSAVYPIIVSVSLPEIDKANWTIKANSEESAHDQTAAKLIDNDDNSFWHSQWNAGKLPYEIIIDTQKSYLFTHIGFLQRNDSQKDTKAGELFVSMDGKSWTEVGKFNLEKNRNNQITEFVSPTLGQYIKIVITESYRSTNDANLSEIYLYGLDSDNIEK